MKRTFGVFGLTVLLVAVLDIAVAFTLNWAERTWRFGGLVQYFEYGRSVPGKLEKWRKNSDAGFNLYDVGWREADVATSSADFATEDPGQGPVIRSYGMSFVNNIIENAVMLDPDIIWDQHAGPGVPPNYTYALFEDDRENRRSGDIVVLGVLASTLPAMGSFSNQTWAFEQPAPLTYPIYQPTSGGLMRIDPVITSSSQLSTLRTNKTLAAKWHDQLTQYDAFYGIETHGAPVLDASPFARLIRRAAATSHVAQTKTEILSSQSYPYRDALNQMIQEFVQTAQSDGQVPVVMLVQDKDAGGVNLLKTVQPALLETGVSYFATAEHFDPRDPSGFLSDGHYRPEIDRLFAAAFLKLLQK
jgi:hypothetical protein